ncbi:MAG: polyphosphate kinase 1 [Planctomycetes bacterium]|nr:polyphosphate kinase 1 [Planctomycetota bacterium]
MTRLEDPGHFLNRDLSLLEFNRRVLEQARDPGRPLLERLRALVVLATNLDEFFEIRVAGLRQRAASGLGKDGPDALEPAQALEEIARRAQALVEAQYALLSGALLPALAAEGVRLRGQGDLAPAEREWARHTFAHEVAPVLTPIRLDPMHPFPRVQNRRLSYLLTLRGQDWLGRRHDRAVALVQVPRALPTILHVPPHLSGRPWDFVLLATLVAGFGHELFEGMEVTGTWPFRVTRNSELQLDEVGPENLRQAVEDELPQRETGEPVRLELAAGCPDDLQRLLLDEVGLEARDVYLVDGPIDLRRLEAVYQKVDRPDLKFPPLEAPVPPALARGADLLGAVRAQGALLLHHPFEAFAPVVGLVQQAAADPAVVALKQTLYRATPDSPIVEALAQAAQAGKDVLAAIELRARFSESQNLQAARRLERAGARVVYGQPGHKAHGKLLLVERREGEEARRYVHLGTGNYHQDPLQPTTDWSLLTCDPGVGHDVALLFATLAGDAPAAAPATLWAGPFDLRERLVGLVDQAAAAARRGEPARVAAKLNALTDEVVIAALYRASQAGATVDLVVRGMCSLRPGVPGLSERIRVRSVLGRFLEHSRCVVVRAGDDEVALVGSADWTPRNLLRRVEACARVDDPALRRRLLDEGLAPYLAATHLAWELLPDGSYRPCAPDDGRPPVAAQDALAAAPRGGRSPASAA